MNAVEYVTRRFKVIRRTSQYNKYIKWYAETYHDDGTVLSSCGFRTEKQARESVMHRENPFPIGDRRIFATLEEISE
ncbi:MAG: hypothetical protein WCO89_00035 [Syntrophus sp. (in: bacteria)]